jgi:hypothetical protein
MEWALGYLISVVIMSFIMAAFVINDNDKVVIDSSEELIVTTGQCLLWPLWLGFYLIRGIVRARFDSIRNKAQSIVERHRLNRQDDIDRETIVCVDESDLKYLLKASRGKYYELSSRNIVIIREELMHRNAERSFMS